MKKYRVLKVMVGAPTDSEWPKNPEYGYLRVGLADYTSSEVAELIACGFIEEIPEPPKTLAEKFQNCCQITGGAWKELEAVAYTHMKEEGWVKGEDIAKELSGKRKSSFGTFEYWVKLNDITKILNDLKTK